MKIHLIKKLICYKKVASEAEVEDVLIECCSPSDEVRSLTTLYDNGVFSANFRPKSVGKYCQLDHILFVLISELTVFNISFLKRTCIVC